MFERKNLESRSFVDEVKNLEKDVLFDLGHPLLNRIAHCFVRAAGIGAVQALSKEAYFTAVEGCNGDVVASQKKAKSLAALRGKTNQKSVEALMKRSGKETLQWGMVTRSWRGPSPEGRWRWTRPPMKRCYNRTCFIHCCKYS